MGPGRGRVFHCHSHDTQGCRSTVLDFLPTRGPYQGLAICVSDLPFGKRRTPYGWGRSRPKPRKRRIKTRSFR